ncbi:MAG: DUF6048 family protein [Bacteroidota bacterium]
MKMKHICIFIISLFAVVEMAQAQQDTLYHKERYGLSLGADLVKPLRGLISDDYRGGFELNADYRITKRIWLAGELGNDNYRFEEGNLNADTNGSYIKLGGNYNFFTNWIGMENQIYVGFRYAFSTFSHTLNQYTVTVRNNYFPPDIREVDREYDGLNATWAEFHFGIRVEVFRNIFMGAHVQLKFLATQTDVNNFDHLNIPGFNRTNDNSSIGAGIGYSIRYLIPLKTKTRKQAIKN